MQEALSSGAVATSAGGAAAARSYEDLLRIESCQSEST